MIKVLKIVLEISIKIFGIKNPITIKLSQMLDKFIVKSMNKL